MTLRARISAAERSVTGADTADHLRLLVELVGRRDATFWPWRDPSSAVGVVQRRRRYLAGVEGIAAKADGRSSWKPSHEARRHLVADGFAEARMASGQVSSLFVTEAGDATARAIVGDLPSLFGGLLLLARLRTTTGREFCGRTWVSESALFGRDLHGDPSSWDDETEMLLPLLVRGLVDSRCDGVGRIYFTATFDPDRDELPVPVETDAVHVPAGWDWYIAAFRSERDTLRVTEPFDSAEIVIPLPVTW